MTQVAASPRFTESSASEMLDRQDLYDRCMGNKDLVRRVLQKLQQRIPEEMAEMERALELGDLNRVASIAHRVKGAAANVSAARMVQVVAKIEDSSRGGCKADVVASIEHLHNEWEGYLEHIRALLSDQ